MIKRLFKVCGITSSDPIKIRNEAFLTDFMKKINDDMEGNDDNIFQVLVY